MTRIDPAALAGAWRLTRWHNTIDGRVSTPLGGEPHGLLIYAADGWMAVQITASHRAAIDTADPLGGDELQRAAAYATSLSYCGRYEVDGEQLIHAVALSSFPNWAGQRQIRLAKLDGDELVLRTPQARTAVGVVASELRWVRA